MKALLSRHRRLLAALFAAAAVAAGLAAARPHPGGVRVLVAARDLAAGTTLRPGDLAVRTLPRPAVPDGVVSRAAGRTLSAPVRRGEPLTDVRLRARRFLDVPRPGGPAGGASAAPGGCSGAGTPCSGVPGPAGGSGTAGVLGDVATPVRLADAAVAGLLRPGDLVDVLAARADGPPSARTIAAGVPVVAVPRPGPDATEGALVVLRTSREQSATLARAAVDSRLTVAIVG